MNSSVVSNLCVSVLLILSSVAASPGVQARTGVGEGSGGEAQTSRLPNGIVVAVSERPGSNLAAISVGIGGGSRAEPAEGPVGQAHFVEHMFFQGTPRFRFGEIDWEIEAIGGRVNAWTARESMNLHLVFPSEHFDRAAELLADMVVNASFPLNQFEDERRVLRQNLLVELSDPRRLAMETLFAEALQGHPLSRPVGGSLEALDEITLEMLLEYRDRYVVTENLTIAVVGDVGVDHALDRLGQVFGGVKRGARVQRQAVRLTPGHVGSRVDVPFPGRQAYVAIGLPVPGFASQERYALQLIAAGLASARIYPDLVASRGLSSSVSSGYAEFSDAGLLHVQLVADAEDVPAAIDVVSRQLVAMALFPPSDATLRAWSSVLAGQTVLARESMLDRAGLLADGLLLGSYLDSVTYEERLRAVTSVMVQSVARRLLDPDRATIVVVGPGTSPSYSGCDGMRSPCSTVDPPSAIVPPRISPIHVARS